MCPRALSTGFLAIVSVLLAVSSQAAQPSLPLPSPAPEEVAIDNWIGERDLSNSVRAWHYNPAMVQPLLDVGSAVEDTTLTLRLRRMLALVVASLNECRY